MKSVRAIIFFLCVALTMVNSASGVELTKLRIGWQVPWATQGQLVQILKHTDILEKNGLKAEFVGRTYGPVLNEIALAGDIDVVLTADQPAAALFSKGKGWIGVGRLMYNRTLTYVPPKSSVKTIRELRGKTIGIPIGAAAERVTNEALVAAGLDPKKDVKIINLGIREQGPLVLKGKDKKKWGNIDEKFIENNNSAADRMMQAIYDAYDYYRQNISKANKWFMEEARLKGSDQKACDIAASIEPNVWCKSRSEIRVTFTSEDFKIMQRASDFLAPKLKKRVDMMQFVSNRYASNAK